MDERIEMRRKKRRDNDLVTIKREELETLLLSNQRLGEALRLAHEESAVLSAGIEAIHTALTPIVLSYYGSPQTWQLVYVVNGVVDDCIAVAKRSLTPPH